MAMEAHPLATPTGPASMTHYTDQMADNAARALSPENAAILRRVAASEPFDCRREGVSQTRLKGLRNKTLVRAEPLELVWYVTEFGRAVLERMGD